MVTNQEIMERECNAKLYLASMDARKGRPFGTSERRAAPPVLLALPLKVPYDVLKRMTSQESPLAWLNSRQTQTPAGV